MSDRNEWRIKAPAGFERDEVTTNGIRTVIYSAGSGRPVVFWHGAGTFHGIDFATDWAEHFRILLPHHPGFGESGPAPQIRSMDDLLAHYLDLFESLGLERFDLIGLSLGGWMAAEFAAAHPGRLRRLVLVAPAGLPDADHPTTDLDTVPPEEILSYLAHDVSVFSPHLPEDEAGAEALRRLQSMERDTLARVAPDGPVNPDLEAGLKHATVPTLLIWGREDRLTPAGKVDKWLRCLPDARSALFGEAGHMVLDESAAARQAVTEFLAD